MTCKISSKKLNHSKGWGGKPRVLLIDSRVALKEVIRFFCFKAEDETILAPIYLTAMERKIEEQKLTDSSRLEIKEVIQQ
jgi:hypothetical protein